MMRPFKLPALLGVMSVCAAAVLSSNLSGQEAAAGEDADLKAILELMRSDLNGHKIRTLNTVMRLTAAEAEKFWPIYREYEADLMKLEDRNVGLIREFLELQASGTPADTKWNSLAKDVLDVRKDRLNLWSRYQRRIARSVSPFRAAQFLQVEHQIRLFIDLSIASEMPVIGSVTEDEILAVAESAPKREESVLVTVTATVESIDHERREVVLRGPLGNEVALAVDERVKRLHEIKAGDTVRADYYISVAGELREPTAEERANPLVIFEDAARAPEGETPAGGVARVIRAVCTIEGLSRVDETVTLKGPLGRLTTVRASDPANLPNLRIGETVVVTYSEALAIGLEEVD